MKNFRRYLPHILVLCLLFLVFFIWQRIYTGTHHGNILKVAFLNVGQGDAIYIEAPNGRQMLIDSGVGPIVLSKLGEVMPFADRSLDVVLATHADADHIGGFSSVLDKYKVGAFIDNGAEGNTETYHDLKNKIAKHKIKKVVASRGMRVVLDKENNIYFDILFPDRDVSNFDSNDASIVGKLSYGEESFMFTGDAPFYTELLITNNETPEVLSSNVLKLGHHGSKYSSSDFWLKAVRPEIAIISAGLRNRYGHPNAEVLQRLDALHIPYLATYQKATILFKTDGLTLTHN